MSEIVNGRGDDASDAVLVDVTRLPLNDLVSLDDSALANAIRRVLQDLERPHDTHATWQSYQP
jgi:FXSXX-COOH protein